MDPDRTRPGLTAELIPRQIDLCGPAKDDPVLHPSRAVEEGRSGWLRVQERREKPRQSGAPGDPPLPHNLTPYPLPLSPSLSVEESVLDVWPLPPPLGPVSDLNRLKSLVRTRGRGWWDLDAGVGDREGDPEGMNPSPFQ